MNPLAILQAKRASLLAGRDMSAVHVAREADETDNARNLAERELTAQLSDADAVLLRQVNAALVRIADGSYGECIACSNEIAPARLAALPWAPLCLGCQGKIEAKERLTGRHVDLFDELVEAA